MPKGEFKRPKGWLSPMQPFKLREELPKTEIDWSGFPKSTQEQVGYVEHEKSLNDMTCNCMRPAPGDFTANCRNCGFRIKDNFDKGLDSLKEAVNSKYPEQKILYSEEEVNNMLTEIVKERYQSVPDIYIVDVKHVQKVFEQFKKK